MKATLAIWAAVAAFFVTVLVTGISGVGALVLGLTIIYLLQGALTTVAMLHSWTEPKRQYHIRPPKDSKHDKQVTFSLIIPCRHEESVIGETLMAVDRIDYPKDDFEVLVSVRDDDTGTILAIQQTVQRLYTRAILEHRAPTNITLVTFSDGPLMKARNLNAALQYARFAYVGVFDAEDEPHPQILKKVEAVIHRKNPDAIQAGVQLVNVSSRWFTALNCVEYYYWFKSVLPFLAKLGATPVGGNTVFFRSTLLNYLGGWDEKCLTEDADIGIQFSAEGYRIVMVYDESLATLEEAPVTLRGFLHQRTRWDQGYLQVLGKRDWARLSSFKQQFLTLYLLIQPFFQLLYAFGAILMPLFAFFIKIELPIAVFSIIPLYFLVLQIGIYTLGLSLLRREYQLQFSRTWYPLIWLVYFPYQILLGLAVLRAFARTVAGMDAWEKTAHINVHREFLGIPSLSLATPFTQR
jgi:cellulose synthase/poly-beta-1,6-N-acetylglucosamine synthase-like glycosyltransferase